MSSPLLPRLAVVAASSLLLAAAAPSFGPPWISIETPPNPYDASSRGAVLVVHTFHHQQVVASGVTGTAEGLVAGSRRSITLKFDTTSRPGSYALRKQWPSEGVWMLVLSTGEHSNAVTALVDIGPAGEVANVRVPTRRERGWDIPVEVTAKDVNAALEARAGAALSARR